jgi:hypothetical protein
MQRVYGVGDCHGNTLSYSYGTICLKQYGPSLDGAYPSAERRKTHSPIQRHDAFTWGQDLDGIEVKLLQFGDALHQCRDTKQQRYQRLTIARGSSTIAIEEDIRLYRK